MLIIAAILIALVAVPIIRPKRGQVFVE